MSDVAVFLLGSSIAIVLGYGVARTMEGKTALSRFLLRRKLARRGLKPCPKPDDRRLRGLVDGVEVEVEVLVDTEIPYLVTATCKESFEGLVISAAPFMGARRGVSGDEAFDNRVLVEGPRVLTSAVLGVGERAVFQTAIASEWSFAQSRWSRVVQWPGEVEGAVEDGARLAQMMDGVGASVRDPLARVAELYRTDLEAGVRAARLDVLLEADEASAGALAKSALEDVHDEVRLVAARHFAAFPTLVDLVVKTASEPVRKAAFQAMVQLGTPEAWASANSQGGEADPAMRNSTAARPAAGQRRSGPERASDTAWSDLLRVTELPRSRAEAIGALIAAEPFPGRLELARRWVESSQTHLYRYAWRVFGAEGDRSDLERVQGHPSERELEQARAAIRARLVAEGHGVGGLALAQEGGGLAVVR